jgi:pimeloyl-ACP methyl ester carboxylesterase
MAAGAASALAASPSSARTRKRKQGATFVLVHGAWHGAWAWTRVRALLEAEGARVYAPTMTGLGERAHVRAPVPGLSTHVEDVARCLFFEDLRDVVLVGHSYGGMVITGAADAARDRLSALVYLDAAVPMNGQSMATQKPGVTQEEVAGARAGLSALARDGAWISVLPLEAYGYHGLNAADAAWVTARLTPHPLGSWFEPLALKNDGGADLPRTYIHCANPPLPQSSMPFHAALLKKDPAWRYREIDDGHGAMMTSPEAVGDLLLEAAAAAG